MRPFVLIAETDAWLVVDKPPFLLIHPKKPDGTPTLWGGLRELLAYELANGGQVSIVNRLDRETSGLVLVAKTTAAARAFHSAMAERKIRKEYLAICHGWPEETEFTVNAPILRQGERLPSAIYLKRCVHPEGAEAVTRFRVEKRLQRANRHCEPREAIHPQRAGDRFSLVRAWPETGRTHQIRVHLAHVGHPIVGDKIYGPDERAYLEFIQTGWTSSLQTRLLLPRQALHSASLSVEIEGQPQTWHAPLASDLAQWMDIMDTMDTMDKAS